MFKYYPEIFTKEFDILNFKQTIGKGNTYGIVCGNIFDKNKLFTRIYKSTFIRFIDEMSSAYLDKNPYHNVNKNK